MREDVMREDVMRENVMRDTGDWGMSSGYGQAALAEPPGDAGGGFRVQWRLWRPLAASWIRRENKLCRELCRVFEEAPRKCAKMPWRPAQESLKPGLKPLTRFRLKAGLRQGVAGAPGLVSKADAEVGVPASAGSRRRPSGLGHGRKPESFACTNRRFCWRLTHPHTHALIHPRGRGPTAPRRVARRLARRPARRQVRRAPHRAR